MISAILIAVLDLLDRYGLHIATLAIITVLLVGMHRRTRQIERDRENEDMRRHVNEASQ